MCTSRHAVVCSVVAVISASQSTDYHQYQPDLLNHCRELANNGDCLFKQQFMAANCDTTCAAFLATCSNSLNVNTTTMPDSCSDPDRLMHLQQAHVLEGDSLTSTDIVMTTYNADVCKEIEEFITEANGTEDTITYGELDFHATEEMFKDAEWGFYSGDESNNKQPLLMFAEGSGERSEDDGDEGGGDGNDKCQRSRRQLIFYDLGSGTGKIAGRAWARGWDARGVEFSKNRFQRSCNVIHRLKQTWKRGKLITKLRGQLKMSRCVNLFWTISILNFFSFFHTGALTNINYMN